MLLAVVCEETVNVCTIYVIVRHNVWGENLNAQFVNVS